MGTEGHPAPAPSVEGWKGRVGSQRRLLSFHFPPPCCKPGLGGSSHGGAEGVGAGQEARPPRPCR